jgi:hypothetical protein
MKLTRKRKRNNKKTQKEPSMARGRERSENIEDTTSKHKVYIESHLNCKEQCADSVWRNAFTIPATHCSRQRLLWRIASGYASASCPIYNLLSKNPLPARNKMRFAADWLNIWSLFNIEQIYINKNKKCWLLVLQIHPRRAQVFKASYNKHNHTKGY